MTNIISIYTKNEATVYDISTVEVVVDDLSRVQIIAGGEIDESALNITVLYNIYYTFNFKNISINIISIKM